MIKTLQIDLAFYLLPVWLWVKMRCKWWLFFLLNYFIFKIVFANSFFSQFKEAALKVYQMSFM